METDRIESLFAAQGLVFRYIHKHLPSIEDAQDLTQETLLSGFTDFNSFLGESAFSSWLIGIAKHKIGHLRVKVTGRGTTGLREAGVLKAITSPVEEIDFDEILIEQLDCNANLDLLNQTDSEILRLRYLEGYSFKELALLLDRSRSALERRITKAKNNYGEKGNWDGYCKPVKIPK